MAFCGLPSSKYCEAPQGRGGRRWHLYKNFLTFLNYLMENKAFICKKKGFILLYQSHKRKDQINARFTLGPLGPAAKCMMKGLNKFLRFQNPTIINHFSLGIGNLQTVLKLCVLGALIIAQVREKIQF